MTNRMDVGKLVGTDNGIVRLNGAQRRDTEHLGALGGRGGKVLPGGVGFPEVG